MTSPPPTTNSSLFRPTKKRKTYRQRVDPDEDIESLPHATSATAPVVVAQSLDELIASRAQDAEREEEGLSMAEILRLRKMKRVRGGVGFSVADSNSGGRGGESPLDGQVVVAGTNNVQGEGEEEKGGVVRKFAPQTGVMGDVDRHM
jgi:hypothetical protein